jgi:dihydroxyacetone kinase-like protein
MSAERWSLAIERAAAVIADNADLLTELDSAIGDGDHGANMTRGFKAIAAEGAELAGLAPGAALQKAGMTLVMKVGGASGPLYGSLLMGMGKAAGAAAEVAPALLAAMLGEGVDMVKRRGKSTTGEKTMLDVLVPVHGALAEGVAEGLAGAALAARLVATAEAGLEATRELQATKGRASYLGERSIGHLDPGAMSSCLLIKELCAVFGDGT